jgi:hypothetical protein
MSAVETPCGNVALDEVAARFYCRMQLVQNLWEFLLRLIADQATKIVALALPTIKRRMASMPRIVKDICLTSIGIA